MSSALHQSTSSEASVNVSDSDVPARTASTVGSSAVIVLPTVVSVGADVAGIANTFFATMAWKSGSVG